LADGRTLYAPIWLNNHAKKALVGLLTIPQPSFETGALDAYY